MPEPPPILIRNAELDGSPGRDLLAARGRIVAIGAGLEAPPDAEVLDAAGGALLPGLTDHHLHLAALAAARASSSCGPPEVTDADSLVRRLRVVTAGRDADVWIRGIGYHESVAGDIDAAWLDAAVADRPVRIQHRGGRLWVFNSRALEHLRPRPGDPLERIGGRLTGRLFDGDVWLRQRLGTAAFPDLGPVSQELAGHGITAVTDTTPHNGPETLELVGRARERGQLLQSVTMMGGADLDTAATPPGITRGARKFHLLESDLPDFDAVCAAVDGGHRAGRNAAFHCVTRAELVFALAALRAAGSRAGDRIEHASVTPPELLEELLDLGLTVVTQPVFVYQRGDHYLAQVASEDRPWLYRLRAFLEAGVPLAGSSDAPFGDPNPWLSMSAAVSRSTRSGRALGAGEALTPEQALALYTAPPQAPGARRGPLRVGETADLCLLAQSWARTRTDLTAADVRLTLASGRRIHG